MIVSNGMLMCSEEETEDKYSTAVSLMDAKQYAKAIDAFEECWRRVEDADFIENTPRQWELVELAKQKIIECGGMIRSVVEICVDHESRVSVDECQVTPSLDAKDWVQEP